MGTDTKKWMQRLSDDFGVIAADLPTPSDSVIRLPSPSLNWALSNGGIVESKAVLFFGPESSGKSLLAQLAVIEIQKKHPDGICIWMDCEFSFDKIWFSRLGGDVDRLLVRQTNDPLKIFDWMWGDMLKMIQDGCPIRGIALDSFRSIRYPKDIKTESTKQTQGGSGAAYLTSALKGLLPIIRQNNITFLGVQQVYEEMDEYRKMRNPFIIPDGRALKHFCDYMIQVDKLETKDGIVESGKNMIGTGLQVGHKVRCKVKKNRVGSPYRVAQFTLDYTKGIINQGSELFDLAKSLDIIYHPLNPATNKENPQMWQFANHEPIRGEDNIRQWVVSNKPIQDEITAACEGASAEVVERRNAKVEDTVVEIDVDND